MNKYLSIAAAFGSALLVSTLGYAQTGKAPCSSFQKLPDGKWTVVKPIKIQNGNASVTLNTGTPINPETRVVGVNIYAALEKSCH